MQTLKRKSKDIPSRLNLRSPTLDTVFMVEEAIKKNSGDLTQRKLWKKLPKKVMWQTFKIILNYLVSINKIGIGKKKILVYIWNPKLADKYMKMENIKV
jgi:hypothetical protein